MALILKKKAAAPAPSTPIAVQGPILSEFADLIDQVGDLAKEADKINAKIVKLQEQQKPYLDKLKELVAMIEDLPAGDDDKIEELGERYRAEAGKRSSSRSISDLDKVKEFLGPELFMQLAKVNIGDIDDYLTPPQREVCLKTTRGKRTVKVVERAA